MSSKATSSKLSKSSSRRHRDLFIAKHKGKEIERQNDIAMRPARQKEELELELLQEETRKRLAEAHLVESLRNKRRLSGNIVTTKRSERS